MPFIILIGATCTTVAMLCGFLSQQLPALFATALLVTISWLARR